MYSDVALNPKGEYHFEMGRSFEEKLGNEKFDLDPSSMVTEKLLNKKLKQKLKY